MRSRRIAPMAAAAAATFVVTLTGCAQKPPDPLEGETAQIRQGQQLFSRNCAMCHTMDVAGSQGSAVKIRDRERVDGPSFNDRRETKDAILYAIRNGGFSGAIMPENIVVGKEADAVAAFLEKYAGRPGKNETPSNSGADGELTGSAGGNG